MLQWLALAALVVAGCVSAADAQQYDSVKDLFADNADPTGIWSNGATMWVADYDADKIYAYKMPSMSRDSSKDITLSAGNTNPWGIWSNGNTMWVANYGGDKIYAYDISTRSPVPSKDLTPSAANGDPTGIWSNGNTMWVLDYTDYKIYAYDISTRSPVPSKDFTLPAAGNNIPWNIWSDRTTIWVVDSTAGKIYAYKMSDKSRIPSKDFTLSADNGSPTGIWSDRTTMWVADYVAGKIYVYKIPTTSSASSGLPLTFFLPPPPPRDTTPPTVVSVERTGNATTTDRALTWNVTFSEAVVVGADAHINYTSVANVTIPDLGAVHDTVLVNVPGAVTGGNISVDLYHPITSGLLIELVAPDCTQFVIHNQTTAFLYKLRQPRDLGDLAGVEAAGQWTLHVSDHAKYWNGTLNTWSLELESDGAVEGSGDTYAITRHVAGPGNHTLSLDGYEVRDRAGNPLADADPAVNEPYRVVGAAARTCQTK